MKVIDLLESEFDPEDDPALVGRAVIAAIKQYHHDLAIIQKYVQDGVAIPRSKLRGGKAYQLKSWTSHYIPETPENAAVIARVKRLDARIETLTSRIMKHAVDTTGSDEQITEQWKLLDNFLADLRHDAEFILDDDFAGQMSDDGEGGLFAKHNAFKTWSEGEKQGWFVVYKVDDIIRYARKKDRNNPTVQKIIHLNDQIDQVIVRQNKLYDELRRRHPEGGRLL